MPFSIKLKPSKTRAEQLKEPRWFKIVLIEFIDEKGNKWNANPSQVAEIKNAKKT